MGTWTVLPQPPPKKQSVLSSLIGGIAAGAPDALQALLGQKQQREEDAALEAQGIPIKGIKNPELRKSLLESHYKSEATQAENKRKEALERAAAKEAGYTYGAPPAVAAEQIKAREKNKRLQPYGLGNREATEPNQTQGNESNTPQEQGGSVFSRMNDDQLVTLTGSPDREVAEPAKAELKRKQEERKNELKQQSEWSKFDRDRAGKALEQADQLGAILPQKQSALNIAKDALSSKDLGMFSWDNIADVTSIEGLRSKEGAVFKTAMKEFLLGNISRAGARPNQWIEQQISDMAPKVGRSTEANLSVSRAIQNEIDLDKEREKSTYEIYEDLRKNGENVGDLPTLINRHMAKYAIEKQNELFNDLRGIAGIADKKAPVLHKVAPGTKASDVVTQALLKYKFDNDPDKVIKELERLGYQVDE